MRASLSHRGHEAVAVPLKNVMCHYALGVQLSRKERGPVKEWGPSTEEPTLLQPTPAVVEQQNQPSLKNSLIPLSAY